VLWSLFEFCVVTVSIVLTMMFVESIQEGIVAGTTPEEVMGTVITLLIPPILAFLSLTLKDSINRWLNIIVSIFFIVAIPFATGFGMIPSTYLPSMILISIVEVVALVLIVWFAWKSKQKT